MESILSVKTKIICPNWRETAAFYRDHFAMEVVEEWDEAGDKGVVLGLAGRREALLEVYDGPRHDLSGISLQFRVADVDSFAGILPQTLERDGPTDRPWGARYLIFHDPAGVRIIVYSGGW
ncbi:MAG TPA: VOC family protein [Sphingomicrobium sp.]|nr:VOC family protein [Sphingomicrobium sp.]